MAEITPELAIWLSATVLGPVAIDALVRLLLGRTRATQTMVLTAMFLEGSEPADRARIAAGMARLGPFSRGQTKEDAH